MLPPPRSHLAQRRCMHGPNAAAGCLRTQRCAATSFPHAASRRKAARPSTRLPVLPKGLDRARSFKVLPHRAGRALLLRDGPPRPPAAPIAAAYLALDTMPCKAGPVQLGYLERLCVVAQGLLLACRNSVEGVAIAILCGTGLCSARGGTHARAYKPISHFTPFQREFRAFQHPTRSPVV